MKACPAKLLRIWSGIAKTAALPIFALVASAISRAALAIFLAGSQQ